MAQRTFICATTANSEPGMAAICGGQHVKVPRAFFSTTPS
jgi:hypothetical protein